MYICVYVCSSKIASINIVSIYIIELSIYHIHT